VVRVVLCWVGLIACSSAGPAVTTAPTPPAPVVPDANLEPDAPSEKDLLAAAHRELEDEQQTALAATCDESAAGATEPRCEPSCYRVAAADPRAGTKLSRAVIGHLVCRAPNAGPTDPLVFADELGGAKVAVRAARGKPPKPARPGTWQAEIEAAVLAALEPEVGQGDAIRVTGKWKSLKHPVTKERFKCVVVSHYVKKMRRALDACGGRGAIACEAGGNHAAHGIDVVHYRLAEARQLRAAGNDAGCQQASLEAFAVARGLPRWRQYVALNVDQWKSSPRYRTRFDGILDEDTLFARAIALGAEAQAVHAECGGSTNPTPSAAQEQSFHTCW
jgi:hypothetical protein